jgi:hypothetical protein
LIGDQNFRHFHPACQNIRALKDVKAAAQNTPGADKAQLRSEACRGRLPENACLAGLFGDRPGE